MNLTKEQPLAKYTLEMDDRELHALCSELVDFRGQHPNDNVWPQLTRLRELLREQVL